MWEVLYKDGSTLSQFDSTAPEFVVVPEMVTGGEVPYKAIRWDDVDKISFLNAETGVGMTYRYDPPPEGYKTSLRSRFYRGLTDGELQCFILLVSKADAEVINGESVVQSFYWFPDGSHHWCTQFKCPDIDKWACGRVHNIDHTLPMIHGQLEVRIDTQLI